MQLCRSIFYIYITMVSGDVKMAIAPLNSLVSMFLFQFTYVDTLNFKRNMCWQAHDGLKMFRFYVAHASGFMSGLNFPLHGFCVLFLSQVKWWTFWM
jgi:hypothetical protein